MNWKEEDKKCAERLRQAEEIFRKENEKHWIIYSLGKIVMWITAIIMSLPLIGLGVLLIALLVLVIRGSRVFGILNLFYGGTGKNRISAV